jgi:prolipoprotein diacylglyceryltransferase
MDIPEEEGGSGYIISLGRVDNWAELYQKLKNIKIKSIWLCILMIFLGLAVLIVRCQIKQKQTHQLRKTVRMGFLTAENTKYNYFC